MKVKLISWEATNKHFVAGSRKQSCNVASSGYLNSQTIYVLTQSRHWNVKADLAVELSGAVFELHISAVNVAVIRSSLDISSVGVMRLVRFQA